MGKEGVCLIFWSESTSGRNYKCHPIDYKKILSSVDNSTTLESRKQESVQFNLESLPQGVNWIWLRENKKLNFSNKEASVYFIQNLWISKISLLEFIDRVFSNNGKC